MCCTCHGDPSGGGCTDPVDDRYRARTGIKYQLSETYQYGGLKTTHGTIKSQLREGQPVLYKPKTCDSCVPKMEAAGFCLLFEFSFTTNTETDLVLLLLTTSTQKDEHPPADSEKDFPEITTLPSNVRRKVQAKH